MTELSPVSYVASPIEALVAPSFRAVTRFLFVKSELKAATGSVEETPVYHIIYCEPCLITAGAATPIASHVPASLARACPSEVQAVPFGEVAYHIDELTVEDITLPNVPEPVSKSTRAVGLPSSNVYHIW